MAAAVRGARITGAVLLPNTKFPARIAAAHRVQHDTHLQKKHNFGGLYAWQRENLEGPDFILHDGPPYANGDLHMGHAINKIIKDVINRNHVINGQRVHYVPGWDCHGLPIELKALTADKKNHTSESLLPVQLRQIARNFALKTVEKQKTAFNNWGIMADWENQCYLTLNKTFVQNQLRQFFNLYEKGLVYRDVKPVYWSPSSGTALAEAELEYDEKHESTEVYLSLPLANIPEKIRPLSNGNKISAVIWTTTPWSLVGNQAICYSQNLQYSVVKDICSEQLFIVASTLRDQLEKNLNRTLEEVGVISGNDLSDATYHHPLKEDVLPFLSAEHVSSDKGTGLVHTAPAHGPEDFLVALKNNIKIECYVDEKGEINNVGRWIDGLPALGEAQKKILEKLSDQILYSGKFIHSYPLDWRTKKPVIIRASSQWFIDTDAIKNKALNALESVNILPSASSNQYRQTFAKLIQIRPYWCISRQRLWGTPIPVVYHNDRPLVNKDMIENMCKLIENQGTDCWWLNSLIEIVPESLLKENNVSVNQLKKGKDIMDIWLDSGLSWSHVLNSQKADVYLEGLDQFTGWFQSSLMTSVALKETAPYKTIFVHGFAVDSNGRKMSKSLGNVIDPLTIVSGGKNQQKNPVFGIDTLRWWVASHGTQHSQVIVNNNILNESFMDVSKLRLLIKYLLGCINDLDKTTINNTYEHGYLDSYMLHLLYKFKTEINIYYNSMQFNKVSSAALFFTSNHVSTFYCHAVKDRLYCSSENSLKRRSCQIVLNHVLLHLFQTLGPILPHLVEEAWSYHPINDTNVPYFQTKHREAEPIWERPYVENLMDTVFDIKKDLGKKLSGENTLAYSANIKANPEIFDKLVSMQNSEEACEGDLCDVLQVSNVKLIEAKPYEDEWSLQIEPITSKLCKRCRRFTSNDENKPCERCCKVMEDVV